MAYMSQEKKAVIAAALKGIIPKGWKYSLAVEHHSGIVLNISAGPAELAIRPEHRGYDGEIVPAAAAEYRQLNSYHMGQEYPAGSPEAEIMGKVLAAMMAGNHDNSDSQSDYFDVGWYVYINIGKWNKPFKAI